MKETVKFKSKKEQEKSGWREFLKKIERAESGKQLRILLDSILSKNEKRFIVKRLAAISLIKEGKTYRKIGEALWLSPSTISAIKKNLRGGPSYKSRRDLDREKERQRSFKEKAIPSVSALDYWFNPPPISGRGRWKFLNTQ